MRILLVYPNANRELIGWGDLGAIAEPLALEYVGAAARQLGHDVMILDLRLHADHLVPTLYAFQPDVVGLTGYSMHVLRSLAICRLVKAYRPGCHTVVGGHHATLLPVDFHEPEVDSVVTGEGTSPFATLLSSIEEGSEEPIPGVWRKGSDGRFSFGGEARPIDLATIPLPARDLTANDRHRYFIDWMHPIALVRTSLGCPFRCSFCSLWKIMDGKYLRRDVDRVTDELAGLDEDYVFLVDDEPFVSTRRMFTLADAIEVAGIDKHYFSYCRIDSFLRDRSLMQRWHDIGLRRVFFGLEAVFDDELANYNKRQRRDQIVEALGAAREIGISAMCNFIVKPDYTAERFDEIVDFIQQHNVDSPTFTILTPIPGTDLGSSFDHITEMRPNGRPDWDYFDLQHPVVDTVLDREEFMQRYMSLHRVFAQYHLGAGHPMYQELQEHGISAPSEALAVPEEVKGALSAARRR